MIHAYSELYLGWVKKRLGAMFDAAVITQHMDIDEFADLFSESDVANGIEIASPRYLAGMSGTEMAMEVLGCKIEPTERVFRSDAYWVGFCMADAQWYFDRRFSDLFRAFPCSLLRERYAVYHEMDITATRDMIGRVLMPENIVKRHRERLKMTQRELSMYTGIPVSTLRAYEQGKLDVCNASGYTLSALSRAFGMSIEDVLKGRGGGSHLHLSYPTGLSDTS